MQAVIVPARTLVHINGIPAFLAVDTIVETEEGNMPALVGHHYAALLRDKPVTSAPCPDCAEGKKEQPK